ncbi:hypothetical protein FIBSPDRAFT_847072 [Athelia psychrophila]|uniref:Uncharacterized protein n=1 Tax=Athelia psychrophila TaxID=1759441 RepID=A0A166WMM2_9AGAM|nr:hypothetical protein FIBSPDRAFT_847072 [Fibularhizoctonia sp. CBS 109695]
MPVTIQMVYYTPAIPLGSAQRSFDVRECKHTPAHYLPRPSPTSIRLRECTHTSAQAPHLHTRMSHAYTPNSIMEGGEGGGGGNGGEREEMATATTTTRRRRSVQLFPCL